MDALRGFDMFWIIGANSLVYALNRMSPTPVTRSLAAQLEHADWEGFHFYDLIFPLFIFIAGVSMVFSLTKTLAREGRPEALKRIFWRSVLLYLCGMFYHGGLSLPWPDVRLSGVLNRIALAYFFAGVLFCYFKPRALVGICAGLLIGYWGLMTFVPIRDIQLTREHLALRAEKEGDMELAAKFKDKNLKNPTTEKDSPVWAATRRMFYGTTNWVTSKFDQGRNLSDHFDFQHLPGHFNAYEHAWAEPQGCLSTLPSIALSDLLWRRSSGSRLALGPAVPRHQASLDLVLCVRRRRIQRDAAGDLLPGGGCVASANLVPAVRLDGDELDHHLPGGRGHRRVSLRGGAFGGRRHPAFLRRARREGLWRPGDLAGGPGPRLLVGPLSLPAQNLHPAIIGSSRLFSGFRLPLSAFQERPPS
jgi:hypothetical protein